MDPDNAQNEPMVIKTATPFYKSFKFLTGIGLALLLIFVLGGVAFLQKSSPAPSDIAQDESIIPLKGLIGTVEAVDTKSSLITVKSEAKTKSYQVSNDVLISQMVLGAKSEEQSMKQFSLPTEILYLEDLAKKKGVEVYLVFDQNGKNVTQIQMYPNK